MTTTLDINAPEFQGDLYGNYARLRAQGRVHKSEFRGGHRHSLVRYDDVAAGFRDARLGTSHLPPDTVRTLLDSGHEVVANAARLQQGVLVLVDPPDHTRLRALVSKAFTPRQVEALRGRIEELVDELLAPFATQGAMDLIADLAVPLPLIVIAELLGVPTTDREELKVWSDAIAPILDRTQQQKGTLAAAGAIHSATLYFRELVEARQSVPRDDLISALVAAREQDDMLTVDELVAVSIFLLVAGHETTTNLIGNGTLALLRDPVAFEALRSEPSLTLSAVEELLRYDSPVQRTVRVTLEPIEIGDARIPKGEIVDLVIGSANRDPDRFEAPDQLNLERVDNRHLALGGGIHFCVGAALARLEGQIAIGALVGRFPGMKLAVADPIWRPGNLLRAASALPVVF